MGHRVRGAVGSVGSWDPLGLLGSLRSVATVESGDSGRLRGPWGGSSLWFLGVREVRVVTGVVWSVASVGYPKRRDFRRSWEFWGLRAP